MRRRPLTVLVPLDATVGSARILWQVARLVASLPTGAAPPRIVLARLAVRSGETGRARAALAAQGRALAGLPEVELQFRAEGGSPAAAILALAAEVGADLTAMATRGRGGARRLLGGSVAETVLRASPRPVLLLGPRAHRGVGPPTPLRRVLVPLDGSAEGCAVLGDVGRLLAPSIEPVLLHVRDRAGPGDSARATFDAATMALQARRPSARPTRHREVVVAGAPVPAILDAVASERVDLVAMASHGRTGLDRLRFGSVAEAVARAACVPVLVHRTG